MWLWFFACVQPEVAPVDFDNDGFASDVDCDDNNPFVFPGAGEWCDGVDEDCNGEVDDNPKGLLTFYVDDDDDGYGDSSQSTKACEGQGVLFGGDCDDHDPSRNPAAHDVCNGIDDDCDGDVDDDSHEEGGYIDLDGDGYGILDFQFTCFASELKLAPVGGDCDDNNISVNPGAPESCDSVDHNCDGSPSNGAADVSSWFLDADGDGYGAGDPYLSCVGFLATSNLDGDCDDSNANIFPGQRELCNNLDDNCDGVLDEDGWAVDSKARVAISWPNEVVEVGDIARIDVPFAGLKHKLWVATESCGVPTALPTDSNGGSAFELLSATGTYHLYLGGPSAGWIGAANNVLTTPSMSLIFEEQSASLVFSHPDGGFLQERPNTSSTFEVGVGSATLTLEDLNSMVSYTSYSNLDFILASSVQFQGEHVVLPDEWGGVFTEVEGGWRRDPLVIRWLSVENTSTTPGQLSATETQGDFYLGESLTVLPSSSVTWGVIEVAP